MILKGVDDSGKTFPLSLGSVSTFVFMLSPRLTTLVQRFTPKIAVTEPLAYNCRYTSTLLLNLQIPHLRCCFEKDLGYFYQQISFCNQPTVNINK